MQQWCDRHGHTGTRRRDRTAGQHRDRQTDRGSAADGERAEQSAGRNHQLIRGQINLVGLSREGCCHSKRVRLLLFYVGGKKKAWLVICPLNGTQMAAGPCKLIARCMRGHIHRASVNPGCFICVCVCVLCVAV